MIGVFGRGGKETQASTLGKPGEDTGVDIYMKSQMRDHQRDQRWSLRINAPKSREYFLLLKPPTLLRAILAK